MLIFILTKVIGPKVRANKNEKKQIIIKLTIDASKVSE